MAREPKAQQPAEDQPHPDAAVLQGGPGQDTPAEPTPKKPDAPPLVTVKYGGRDYTVAPEIAEAWGAREREFGQKLSEQGTELGTLRKFKQSVEHTVQPPAEQKRDLGTLLFENPNEAINEIRRGVIEEVRGMYTQDQSTQRFWQKFYQKHEDLDGEDMIVQGIMRQHWGELETLPVSAAQDKIADLAREEVLRIARKLKGGKDEELPSGRAVVEGATTPARPRKAEPEGEPPRLSEVIRANRARRLQPTPPKG